MLIAQITNPQPVDYRVAFPNTSFTPNGPDDAWLAEQGYAKVNVWRPHDAKTQKLVPCEPVYEAPWVYTVAVADKTQEDMGAASASEAANVRAQRDRLLAACDWRVIKALEAGQGLPADWAAYRQALRDVPSQAGFPWTIDWPHDPNWVAPNET